MLHAARLLLTSASTRILLSVLKRFCNNPSNWLCSPAILPDRYSAKCLLLMNVELTCKLFISGVKSTHVIKCKYVKKRPFTPVMLCIAKISRSPFESWFRLLHCCGKSSVCPYATLRHRNHIRTHRLEMEFYFLENISRQYLRLRLCYTVASSVTLCIVAKRCVLEQKLLLRAYRKSYQNEWPWPLFRGPIKVTSTIALLLTLNISETVRDTWLRSKGPPIGNGMRAIKWSRDRWRQSRDDRRRCDWDSMVGYPKWSTLIILSMLQSISSQMTRMILLLRNLYNWSFSSSSWL